MVEADLAKAFQLLAQAAALQLIDPVTTKDLVRQARHEAVAAGAEVRVRAGRLMMAKEEDE